MQALNDWLEWAAEYLDEHRAVSLVLVIVSVLSFVVGIVATPRLLARLPVDYFLHERAPLESLRARHPVARVTLLVLKNGLGLVLLVAGLLMLVLPGQGLLTMLVGLLFLDVPGKRRLLVWLVRRKPVFKAINWIRERAGRPPLLAHVESNVEK